VDRRAARSCHIRDDRADDAEQDCGRDSGASALAEARRAHIGAPVGLFSGDRFVTGMMADAGVITLRGLLAGFHAAYHENDRTTWATPRQLQN